MDFFVILASVFLYIYSPPSVNAENCIQPQDEILLKICTIILLVKLGLNIYRLKQSVNIYLRVQNTFILVWRLLFFPGIEASSSTKNHRLLDFKEKISFSL